MTSERPLAGKWAVVVNWRDPDHHQAGGSEIYAWHAARALRDAGARVQFLTSRDRGQDARSMVDGIDVRRAGGRFSVYVWTLVLLLLQRRRVDLVLDVENGIPSFSPLVLRRRTKVVLVVHHVHLDQFGTHFPPAVAWWGRVLEGRLMPVVYRRTPVVAVSESTREEMTRRLRWRRPVQVVHNGCDLASGPREEGAGPRLAVLGRLVAHKRVDRVVEAVATLRSRGLDLPLDVIGRGPEQESLAELAQSLGVDDLVTLHGFVDEEVKVRLLGRATLHVCASEGEGWGQVVLEAAAMGVPTLAHDVPGLRDSILPGRTGWLLPASDDGLAEGISRALAELEEPGYADRLGRECRQWAQGFTWEAMRAEVVRIMEEEVA